MATRSERLDRLTRGNSFLSRSEDDGSTKAGETKIGTGFDNILIGKDGFSVNRSVASAPGLTINNEGTRLRTGPEIRTTADFQHVQFDDGGQGFHVLGDKIPSSVTNPQMTIVYRFETAGKWLLHGPMKEALTILDALRGG